MQLRSLFKAGLLVSMLGLAGVYVTTIPSVLPPGALKPRNADLGNGEAMFNAGGCASCHATPKQANRLKLGGG
jgi:mono/diheme cytochrome c family protein